MPEIIRQSLDIAKEHGLGPSGAVWIIIFSGIAWVAGKSGVGAVKFVRGLLDTSTNLRDQIAKELSETRVRQLQNEQTIREQSLQIARQEVLIDQLRGKLREAGLRADDLLVDLERARRRRQEGE